MGDSHRVDVVFGTLDNTGWLMIDSCNHNIIFSILKQMSTKCSKRSNFSSKIYNGLRNKLSALALTLNYILFTRTCYSSDPWGGYGMDWFDAMQCCYYQNSYLAEPTSAAETEKINTYLTICE